VVGLGFVCAVVVGEVWDFWGQWDGSGLFSAGAGFAPDQSGNVQGFKPCAVLGGAGGGNAGVEFASVDLGNGISADGGALISNAGTGFIAGHQRLGDSLLVGISAAPEAGIDSGSGLLDIGWDGGHSSPPKSLRLLPFLPR